MIAIFQAEIMDLARDAGKKNYNVSYICHPSITRIFHDMTPGTHPFVNATL